MDQNGAPVEGAAVQICDAASCRVGMTDAGGLYTFHSAPCAWEVHVLTAPNGYTADHEEILHTALSGGELTFNLTKN